MAFDPKAALKYRLILIEGDYASERKKALDGIVEAAELADADAFDRESIVSNEKPFAEWISSASTTPFLAERRCVIVRNIYRVDPEDKDRPIQTHLLDQLPESALLILVGDEEASAKEGSPAGTSSKAAWRKVVKNAKGLIEKFEVPSHKTGGGGLQSIAKAGGKKISPRAVSLLIEMTSNRVDRAEEELQKLILFVGEAPEIFPEDIKRSVRPEPEHNVFMMLDACWRGDAANALGQLQRLRGLTRDFDSEARRLLPMIAGQIRNLWQARGVVERMGGEWELVSKPFSKMHEYAQQKAVENARRLDFDQLLACMHAVRHANAHLTGQSLGVDAEEVVEQMVLRLCQIGQGKKSA